MRQRSIPAIALLALPTLCIGQAQWSQLYSSASPPPRRSAVMACFEATGDVLLLSGRDAGGELTDAWRLQGNAWTPIVGTLPPPRVESGMVYDSARQRLVVFGGFSSNAPNYYLDDTWEWDGSVWSNPDPLQKPPARASHGMAFDRNRAVTVLCGGYGPGTNYADLWEWDGAFWVLRAVTNGPGPRNAPLMAFDPVRGNILLHGGVMAAGSQLMNDTWSWTGTSWQQHFPATPPPVRAAAAATADLLRQRVVLHGGDYADLFAWEWDGSEWSLRAQASPGARAAHSMAYDPMGRRVVLFGGALTGNFFLGDTWTYRTANPADVSAFGAGCAGSAGVPQLANAAYSLPWLGDTFTNRVSDIAPNAAGVVFATGFAATAPVSLAPFGMPGCDQLVVPVVSEFRAAQAGVSDWTITIPNSVALANVHLFQQAFVLDASANVAGLVASNGSAVTTGIR